MKLLITTQMVDKNDPILGFFHDWIVEFAKHFETVHVICLREGEHTLPPHVHVHSLGKEKGENRLKYLFRFYTFFGNIFFRERIDFVFFHMGAIYNILAFPFFFMRKVRGTKFYWWKAHGHINFAGRLASFFTDRIYTASGSSFRIVSKKKIVVGHGIKTSGEILSERGIQDTLRIISIGRITRVKNIELVIEVGKILRTRNIPFRVTVIGPVIETAYFEELKQRIDTYGLTADFDFAGSKRKDELEQIYKESDVLVHPSRTGSIDKVVLEAMNAGVVPIATYEAYSDVLGPFGLCVKGGEAEEYAQVLDTLQNMNIGAYNVLRRNLQNEVIKNHSLATLQHRIFNI
jgi:glycosyltransferase involved in cell wall biosynthesis